MTNSQAGWVYSSYQIGYLLSVIFLTSLTDYTKPKYIYVLTTFWAGISGIIFSIFADGFRSALIMRTLMGIGLAGTYMPGLRMVSEKFPSEERGMAIGIYVGIFSLGVSLSLFLTALLNSILSWRWAFFLTSLGPIGGGIIAYFKLGEVSRKALEMGKGFHFREIIFNRPAMRMIGGYVAHMWEMFGMRGWIVAFLTASLITAKYDFQKAVNVSAVLGGVVILVGAFSNAMGGALSDRYGRANTIRVAMFCSGFLSMIFGWTRTSPLWLIFILAILYGFMVTGDSSVLSTGITELVPPAILGRTMALQSLLGFGAASLSPILFGYILDLTNPTDALHRYGYFPNWGWAFMLLGIGGLMGPLIIWKLEKRSNS